MAEDDGGISAGLIREIAARVVYSIFGGASNVIALVNFASSPLQFLRKRVAPVVIGGVFGFVFDLASIIRTPFDAIVRSLEVTGGSLENALSVNFSPIFFVTDAVIGTFLTVSAAFGPLQPFVLAALILAFVYVVFVVGSRVLRAILDAVPVLSGVETFIWG
jgi:hypothetical protein